MAKSTKDKQSKKKAEKASGKNSAKATSKKGAKAAIPHCTCCGKHCPLTKPRCGKGRKLAAKLL
ncbi:MAG TPA: hypothetical protein IAA95_08820 [Candidatus Aveggerthella excrementigallinarum]|nr:hypothetical protein [Candidatus Aveggerthella excrementigallinarum]